MAFLCKCEDNSASSSWQMLHKCNIIYFLKITCTVYIVQYVMSTFMMNKNGNVMFYVH